VIAAAVPQAITPVATPHLWLALAVAALGMFFTLVSAIGILRMPDLYTRMQAAAKAGTLGVALTVASVGVYYPQLTYIALSAVIVLFIFLTAPIASHLIGRAAYFIGVPKWQGHTRDELAGCYDPENHELHNTPTYARPKPNADSGNDSARPKPEASATP